MNRPVHAASLASIVLLVAACGAPTVTTGDAAPEAATPHDAGGGDSSNDSGSVRPDAAGGDDVATDTGSQPDVVAERDAAPDVTTPHDGGGACVSDKLVPTCGGVWWGAAPGPAGLAPLESTIGRSLDIVHSYHVDAQAFPTSEEAAESASGHLLLINWKPSSAVNGWHIAASGSIDTEIGAAADRIATFGHPLFLALFHEPENNLPGGSDTQSGTAADYIAMWHHVRSVFDAHHVTNVVWVWDMMGFSGHAAHYLSGDLYPGDTYVDWIAFDPYASNAATESFTMMVDSGHSGTWPGFYNWAVATHPGMPLMLAEYGVDNTAATTAQRQQWFMGETTSLATLPAIRALVYFNLSNWTMSSTNGIGAGFTTAGHDPQLNPSHH